MFRMFNANVKQVINVTQVVAGKMIADGKKGSIVNVSSQVKIIIRSDESTDLSSLGLPSSSGGPHCLLRHQGSSGHDNQVSMATPNLTSLITVCQGDCPGARA